MHFSLFFVFRFFILFLLEDWAPCSRRLADNSINIFFAIREFFACHPPEIIELGQEIDGNIFCTYYTLLIYTV